MCSVNVRSAEGGRESHNPPPEPWAQCLRIVMSHMKRYLCLNESTPPVDMNSVFLFMKRYPAGGMYLLLAG